MESSEYCEIPDVDSITALPVHTEAEIFNLAINPPLSIEDLSDLYFLEFQPVGTPSSNEEVGASAADLPDIPDWFFQEFGLQPTDEFDTDVEGTPTLVSVNAQPEAINMVLPICHPVAVCEELPNEGISQAVEQQEEPTRQERSQSKGPLIAEPQIGLEDPQLLMVRSRMAKLIEDVRKHSNHLYPSVLPDSFGPRIVEHELPCMKLEPVVIPPVDYPPVQHFSLPSPAPKMEQYDALILFPALADSFSIAPTLLQPQPTSVPSLESSTMVGNMTYLAEAVTHTNVNMIQITQSEAQLDLTTPSSPIIHDIVDLTSPEMIAPADLEVSFTPSTPQDWCMNYSNAIDLKQAIPPPDLEFASTSVIVTPVENLEVMEADNPTKELELVPKLVVPKKRKWKNRVAVEPLLPSLEATFQPMIPKKLPKSTRQQVAGATSAGENENQVAPVVKYRIVWTENLQKRFEEAVTLLGGLGSEESIPRNVCFVMNCKLLTRAHVKSRLQKWKTNPEEFSELVSNGSQLPHMRCSKRRQSGLKASSSELTDQQAAQQTLAGTVAMHQETQQQLPDLLERSKELQAQLDVMAKHSEELLQMSLQM